MAQSEGSSMEELQASWKEMFQKTLPQAATSHSSSQPNWPVHVDHCFARIILDHVVGVDAPWMDKLKSPAYKNMSKEQLEASIKLGQEILDGEVDLVELDKKSLQLRGKEKRGSGAGDKRKRDIEEEDEKKKIKLTPPPSTSSTPSTTNNNPSKTKSNPTSSPKDLKPYISKIALSTLTPFRKKVLTALCQVPRGHYTTYAAISSHLSSSPRAVGNALRNNPFAPYVPCHRVLATGGGLGGFHGSWGRKGQEGLHDEKKRMLLREEGVKFDGKGRVVGGEWRGFK